MTPQQRQIILDEFKKGTKKADIYRLAGVGRTAVENFLSARGLESSGIKNTRWTEEDLNLLRELRNERKLTIAEIWANHFANRTYNAVRMCVYKECDVLKHRKRYKKETVEEIINLLKTTNLLYREIAERMGVNARYIGLLAHYIGIKRKPGRPRKKVL